MVEQSGLFPVCLKQGEVVPVTKLFWTQLPGRGAVAKVASLSGDWCRAKLQPRDRYFKSNKEIEAGGLKVSAVWKRSSRSLLTVRSALSQNVGRRTCGESQTGRDDQKRKKNPLAIDLKCLDLWPCQESALVLPR